MWDMLKVLKNEWIQCINGIFLLDMKDHDGRHVGSMCLMGFLLNLIKTRENG